MEAGLRLRSWGTMGSWEAALHDAYDIDTVGLREDQGAASTSDPLSEVILFSATVKLAYQCQGVSKSVVCIRADEWRAGRKGSHEGNVVPILSTFT